MNLFYNCKVDDNFIRKSFLGGLLYYKKNIKTQEERLRVLCFPFWRKKVKFGYEKLYLFGIAYFKKSSRKLLYKVVLEEFSKKQKEYKHIFINFNCSGETYLYLSYINLPKDSVLIATRKYHIDLCHMMHPEVDCVYLPDLINLRSIDDVYKEEFAGKTFYNVLPFKHFERLERKLDKGEDVHYCEEICKMMGINSTTKAKFPIISEEVKASAIKKAKRISLNLDNFVFIAPESQSNEDPATNFWENIIEDFYKKGLDVFVNVMEQDSKYGCAKTCFLTFEEAYYIASLSKEIIGLRSGFMEPLTTIKNVPITCYYTGFIKRGVLKSKPAATVMRGFSLKKLPNVVMNNVEEICIEN